MSWSPEWIATILADQIVVRSNCVYLNRIQRSTSPVERSANLKQIRKCLLESGICQLQMKKSSGSPRREILWTIWLWCSKKMLSNPLEDIRRHFISSKIITSGFECWERDLRQRTFRMFWWMFVHLQICISGVAAESTQRRWWSFTNGWEVQAGRLNSIFWQEQFHTQRFVSCRME